MYLEERHKYLFPEYMKCGVDNMPRDKGKNAKFVFKKNSTKGKIELQQIHVHSCIYLFVQALKKTGAAVIGPNKQLLVVKNIKN